MEKDKKDPPPTFQPQINNKYLYEQSKNKEQHRNIRTAEEFYKNSNEWLNNRE